VNAVHIISAGRLFRSSMALTIFCAAGLLLDACGPGAPPPVNYLIEAPTSASNEIEPLLGRSVIEVRPVLLPDYLDTSDILVRKPGNVVAANPNARWGERLSVGVTRALAGGLRHLLPEYVVATAAPTQPACQVLVDVETFERSDSGPVTLVAQWRVLGAQTGKSLAAERVSLTEPVTGAGDAEIVGAMSRAVQRLAASDKSVGEHRVVGLYV